MASVYSPPTLLPPHHSNAEPSPHTGFAGDDQDYVDDDENDNDDDFDNDDTPALAPLKRCLDYLSEVS